MKLMNFCLNEKDVSIMANAMNNHRVSKQKPEPIMASLKKNRKPNEHKLE